MIASGKGGRKESVSEIKCFQNFISKTVAF
jgi:hypothetical protein